MKINWIIGNQIWAFKNLTAALIKALPGFSHAVNDSTGDVRFVVSPDQLKIVKGNEKTVFHLDGNRWYNPTGE